MKKFSAIIFLFAFLMTQNVIFCADNSSDNSFDIMIGEVPPGSPHTKSSKGLSDGAVTAIALGSVFGGLGALGAGGYYLYNKYSKLPVANVIGECNPGVPISYSDEFIMKLQQNPSRYNELLRAAQNSGLVKDSSATYFFSPDSIIKNGTINRVFIENPAKTGAKPLNFRVIQYSKSFASKGKMPGLNTRVYGAEKEIPLVTEKVDMQNGILIKKGQLHHSFGKKLAFDTSLVGSQNPKEMDYALIVEFFSE